MPKLAFFSAAGGSLILGDDDAGDHVSEDLPEADGLVDEVANVRAEFTERLDRQNITNVRNWTVDRDHGDPKTADDFASDHAQELLELGTGYLQRSGKKINTRYYLNARIVARCVRLDGQSTTFSYAMRAGEVTKKQP